MRHRARNIVLDPVTIASSGDSLLGGDVIEVVRRELIPRALSGDAQSAGGGRAHRREPGAQRTAKWKCRRARFWRSARAMC